MGTYGYGLQSRSGSAAFSAYQPVSGQQAYPSPQANPSQAGFLGDYSSIAASTAAGSSVVDPLWADTRNASASQSPDEDVFVKSVTLP